MGGAVSAMPAPSERHADLLPSYVLRDAAITPDIVRLVRASWEQVSGSPAPSQPTAGASTWSSVGSLQPRAQSQQGGGTTGSSMAPSTSIVPASEEPQEAGDATRSRGVSGASPRRTSLEGSDKDGATGSRLTPTASTHRHAGWSKGGQSQIGSEAGIEGTVAVAPPSTASDASGPFNTALVRFYDAFYDR
jgi:hypothetical protein